MNKIALIFLPGLMSDESVFQHQYHYLKNIADIKTISLTDVNTPDKMTDKILCFAPEKFALVGHSIGGWIALRIMKLAPERVMKLCILNTSARGIDSDEYSKRQIILDRIKKGEFHRIASETANRFTFVEHAKKDVLNMFLKTGESALINQTEAMMIREDLRDVLSTIHCPTLVIHSEQDQRFTLSDLTEVADGISNSKLKIIKQCGHMSPMEQPDVVTDLMQLWLKEK